MTLTAGTISQVAVAPNYVQLSATVATGGTGPYTYQWYKSTTTGFTPGSNTLIAGATDLTLDDTAVNSNTVYYYKIIALDTGASNAPVTYSQLAVTTTAASQPILNQFRMSKVIGMARLLPQINTISCMVDSSQSGSIVAGQAVKIVDNAGGPPKVIAVAANTDNCVGFVNLDPKNSSWSAGQAVEISSEGNYIYLVSTGAISRGAAVQLDTSAVGGVAQAVTSSGANILGWAYDKATAAGQVIGIKIRTPSFSYA